MIISIIIILLAFNWLLIESDFMRVRLQVGKIPIKQEIKPEPKLDPYKLNFVACELDNPIADNVAQIIIGGKIYESSDITKAIS
jgi:hypothetical protein